MPVPDAVAEQGKIADELFKAQFAPPADPNAPPVPPVTPPATPPAVPGDTPPAPPAVPPATPQVAAPPAQLPLEDSLETWKQRYQTLNGKYIAEVPRLSYRVAYLENQISDLQNQLTSAKTAPPAQPGTPLTTAPDPTGNIGQMITTSEEPTLKAFREQYPDVAQAVAKIVDQAAANITASTESRFKTADQEKAKTAQDNFMVAMNTTVPDWQVTCQQDPNWPAWLSQRDRYANKTRGEMLKDALAGFDSTSVVNMIKDFRMVFPSVTPPAAIPPATPPALPATPPVPTNPRAGAITPPSGPPGVPPGIQPKQLISRKDISEYYANVAKGLYRGQAALQAQIEAEITAAQREGRVV